MAGFTFDGCKCQAYRLWASSSPCAETIQTEDRCLSKDSRSRHDAKNNRRPLPPRPALPRSRQTMTPTRPRRPIRPLTGHGPVRSGWARSSASARTSADALRIRTRVRPRMPRLRSGLFYLTNSMPRFVLMASCWAAVRKAMMAVFPSTNIQNRDPSAGRVAFAASSVAPRSSQSSR